MGATTTEQEKIEKTRKQAYFADERIQIPDADNVSFNHTILLVQKYFFNFG